MEMKNLLSLLLHVLADFRVIVTAIAFIIIVKIAKGITTYKKKAHTSQPRRQKAAPPPPPSAPSQPAEAESEDDEE